MWKGVGRRMSAVGEIQPPAYIDLTVRLQLQHDPLAGADPFTGNGGDGHKVGYQYDQIAVNRQPGKETAQ